MTLKIEQFERKPFSVDVVLIDDDNMEEAAAWCNGTVMSMKREGEAPIPYVKVEVVRPASVRQTKAFAGDRILHTITGFRVYNEVAFGNAFRPVEAAPYPPEPHATPESVSDQITAEDSENPKSDLELQEIIEEAPEREGTVFRDAISGEYVTEMYAAANPDTTVSETEEAKA